MAPAGGGRRSHFLLLLATAAFLIAAVAVCPVFFLGPLAVLLLVSRPRTPREWFWIVVSAAALLAWFRQPDSLPERTVRAAGVFFVGGFVTMTLAGWRPLFSRAAAAVLLAALAMVGWYVAYHLRFADLQNDIVSQTWSAYRQFLPSLPESPPAAGLLDDGQLAEPVRKWAAAVTAFATFYPAILALMAMAGAWLASIWYLRIVREPIVAPVPPMREFRFNDHLIWVLVLAIGLALLKLSPTETLVSENVLLLVLACYWLRGFAVIRFALRRASPFVIGVVLLIMVPMLAFVLVGCTLLGVADTWLDFRRRMAPPTGVPA